MRQTGSPDPFRAWRRPWFWPALVMGITLADSVNRGLNGFSLSGPMAVAVILRAYSLCLPKAVGRQISVDGLVPLVLLVPPLMLLLVAFAVSTCRKHGRPPPVEAEQWELARHLVVSARLIALLWVAVGGVQWWAASHRWSTIWPALPWVAYLPLALLVWSAVRGPRRKRPTVTTTSAERPKPGEAAGSANR